jgi:hypothetical protein
MMQGRRNSASITFAVPAGAGQYAPEVLYLVLENEPKKGLDLVDRLRAVVRTLTATAEIEVDLMRPGSSDWTLDASWNLDVVSYTTAGLKDLLELAGFKVRIRAKSGGTGGNTVLDVSWQAAS